MLGPLGTLWRESVGLYLRTSASALEVAAESLKSVESVVQGRDGSSGPDLTAPLDPSSDEGRELLEGLQGNILKGHGRDHAMHLFVCFGRPTDEVAHSSSVRKVRAWIADLAERRVTSAAAQLDDQARAKTLTMVLLSSQGYEYLGERRPRDGAFREGLRERGNRLNDPAPQDWETKYRVAADDVHALLIVAALDSRTLDGMRSTLENDLASAGAFILIDERGRQERDDTPMRRAVEHFGFADGVSQPQLIDDAGARSRKYHQLSPLKLVLERDRHGGYGSYLVYRKLEQNVESFNAAVARVASDLGQDPELVAAMAVGRFKNGTPLTTHGVAKPDYDPGRDEDFDYDDDRSGGKCPLHAHIRKTNPRGSLGFLINLLAREQKRRIARRGITYTDDDSRTVGLLFMCFQSDIRDQFEFIQRSWANNRDFSERGSGVDPIIGQAGSAPTHMDSPKWPKGHDSGSRKRVRFDQHVRFLGGEYFFAPSMKGLREIGRGAG